MNDEQQVYARWLAWGTHIALAVLIASFLAYALALRDPHLPPQELAKLWAFPVDHYIAASGAPTGWGWLQLLHKSDYLIFLAVAMLGLLTVLCYARIIPVLLAQGERWRAVIAVLQVLVLLGAALY
ncbi:MAG TPA: hypothetical protein VGJ74_14115 [Burkholderiales bacterium]|jgi:hypothetical protein